MIGVGAVRNGRSIGDVNVHRLVEVPHKAGLKPEPCIQKVEDRSRLGVVARVAGIEMEGTGGGSVAQPPTDNATLASSKEGKRPNIKASLRGMECAPDDIATWTSRPREHSPDQRPVTGRVCSGRSFG